MGPWKPAPFRRLGAPTSGAFSRPAAALRRWGTRRPVPRRYRSRGFKVCAVCPPCGLRPPVAPRPSPRWARPPRAAPVGLRGPPRPTLRVGYAARGSSALVGGYGPPFGRPSAPRAVPPCWRLSVSAGPLSDVLSAHRRRHTASSRLRCCDSAAFALAANRRFGGTPRRRTPSGPSVARRWVGLAA